MRETTVGPVKCTMGAENLILADTRTPEQSLCLPIGHIPDLIRFLGSLDYRGYMRAFRVPVDADAGLEVSIDNGTVKILAIPGNLSLVGIAAHVVGGADEDLEPDCEVKVELQLGERVANLKGIVRRRKQASIGIEFAECFRNGCLDPPDDLRQIVAQLEILWIRAKAQHASAGEDQSR